MIGLVVRLLRQLRDLLQAVIGGRAAPEPDENELARENDVLQD